MYVLHSVIVYLIKDTTAVEGDKSQTVVTATYVRFKVTTCSYLSPRNKARSLSTLIAVNVIKETPPSVEQNWITLSNYKVSSIPSAEKEHKNVERLLSKVNKDISY